MTNQPVVDLIRDNLPHLVHPGGDKGPIPLALPMFRNSAIPADQAKQMATEAGLPSLDVTTLTAEAIVALLKANDKTVIDNAELNQLREAAAANETHRNRQVTFGCTCGTDHDLVTATIRDYGTDRPKLNGPQFIRAFSQMNPECSAQHRRNA